MDPALYGLEDGCNGMANLEIPAGPLLRILTGF
jgi:hypothetical protein